MPSLSGRYVFMDVSDFWLRLELTIIGKKKKSLKNVCNKLGVHYQTMVNQKSQQRYPSIEVISKIAREIDCSLDWLVFGKGSYDSSLFNGEDRKY